MNVINMIIEIEIEIFQCPINDISLFITALFNKSLDVHGNFIIFSSLFFRILLFLCFFDPILIGII